MKARRVGVVGTGGPGTVTEGAPAGELAEVKQQRGGGEPRPDGYRASAHPSPPPAASDARDFQTYAELQRQAHPVLSLFGVDTTLHGIKHQVSKLFETFWDNSGSAAMQAKLDALLARFAPHLDARQYLEVFHTAFKEVDLKYVEQLAGPAWGDKVDALHQTFVRHSKSISGASLAPAALEQTHLSLNDGVAWGGDGPWWKE